MAVVVVVVVVSFVEEKEEISPVFVGDSETKGRTAVNAEEEVEEEGEAEDEEEEGEEEAVVEVERGSSWSSIMTRLHSPPIMTCCYYLMRKNNEDIDWIQCITYQ